MDASPIGNRRIRSFDEAKRLLLQIYEIAPARTDLYCGCAFSPRREGRRRHGFRVDLGSCGYTVAKDPTRAERIEWEHAMPAAAFGHSFTEWTEGSEACVDTHGKRFHGRKCARTSPEFSRMEADLHNLFPVVGEVNGLRGDRPMGILDPAERTSSHRRAQAFHFGDCASAIEGGVFLPRREVRGDLARAYEYMHAAYPDRAPLDDAHLALFARWDEEDPPDAWERERNRLILERQGNDNPFVSRRQSE